MKRQHLTTPVTAELLNSIDYVLLDVDGVLWSGDTVIPRVPETIRWLKEVKGKKVRYMTNNSTMSRAEMVPKFRKNGIKDAQFEEIFSSGYAAGLKLRSFTTGNPGAKFNKNVFVLGNQGLIDEIELALAPGCFAYGPELNIQPGSTPDPKLLNLFQYKPANVAKAVFDEALLPPPKKSPAGSPPVKLSDLNIGAVVVGFDFNANMTKLALASILLSSSPADSSEQIPFVATNPDPQLPIGSRNLLMPGAGTLMAFISTACGRKPDVVCGKPETLLMDVLCEVEQIPDRRRCVMVGDRMTTDIDFGTRAGTQTMLVLSGCEKESDIDATGIVPDFIAPSLASLMTLSTQGSKL